MYWQINVFPDDVRVILYFPRVVHLIRIIIKAACLQSIFPQSRIPIANLISSRIGHRLRHDHVLLHPQQRRNNLNFPRNQSYSNATSQLQRRLRSLVSFRLPPFAFRLQLPASQLSETLSRTKRWHPTRKQISQQPSSRLPQCRSALEPDLMCNVANGPLLMTHDASDMDQCWRPDAVPVSVCEKGFPAHVAWCVGQSQQSRCS